MKTNDDRAFHDPLRGLCVVISGAVPEPEFWGEVKDLDQVILRFVSQFSALVLKYGGEIVHGNHPSFTPIVVAQAEAFADRHCRSPLTLVASQLWGEDPLVQERAWKVANVVLVPPVGEGTPDHQETRNDSLTALRLALVRQSHVLVAVGGKLHERTGFHPGVLQELMVARWRNMACFVIASCGGYGGSMDQEISRAWNDGNRMDDELMDSMACSNTDAHILVTRLVDHLIAHRDEFIHQVRAEWPEVSLSSHERRSGNKRLSTVRAGIGRDLIRRTRSALSDLQEAIEKSQEHRVRQVLSLPGGKTEETGP